MSSKADTELSILDLPSIVTLLFERAQRPLLVEAQGPIGLFVRYLRRKPERGLAVIYSVDEQRKRGKHTHANDPNRAVSLTLDEQALQGAHIRFSAAQAQAASLEVQPSGVLRSEDLGLSVQAFPADAGLPALAASCDTSEQSQLSQALESAAHTYFSSAEWHLVSAQAIPVRYKPTNRCVIRYQLVLEHTGEEDPTLRSLTIFGKVYSNPKQAQTVQVLQQQLYAEQISAGQRPPFLPRPLGIIEAIGLTFNEAVQPKSKDAQMLTGTRALRPKLLYGRGGEVSEIVIPEQELQQTARILARLHTSAVQPAEGSPRTGAKEAKRARDRAALIADRNPQQAEEVQRLAGDLASRLETLKPEAYRPAHGGFKSSQLLFHSSQVFVVDFDGFCLADPALDVGYFLAYLRPSALWYRRHGTRAWFEASSEVFTTAYRQAMLEHGVPQGTVDGIVERSRLYEAALIFKIATRRANRLNSSRPKELAAMLTEIATCLAAE